MEINKLMETLSLAQRLKDNTRNSWTAGGRRESVAEHCWRLTLLAFFLRDEFPEADMEKVLHMCLIHDLGEAFTGDIPAFDKTAEDEVTESRALEEWVRSLPEPYCGELRALYGEMDALETVEVRIYKSLDKLEAVLQHNEAPLETWLPLERELNLTYGEENVAFSPYLTALRARLRRDTEAKLAAENAAEEDLTPERRSN